MRRRDHQSEVLGVEAKYRQYEGANPLGFVVSLNLNRRHLSESQRAMVAASLANLSHRTAPSPFNRTCRIENGFFAASVRCAATLDPPGRWRDTGDTVLQNTKGKRIFHPVSVDFLCLSFLNGRMRHIARHGGTAFPVF